MGRLKARPDKKTDSSKINFFLMYYSANNTIVHIQSLNETTATTLEEYYKLCQCLTTVGLHRVPLETLQHWQKTEWFWVGLTTYCLDVEEKKIMRKLIFCLLFYRIINLTGTHMPNMNYVLISPIWICIKNLSTCWRGYGNGVEWFRPIYG